jgi:hypothetical protein
MEPHDMELEDQIREALHTTAAPVHGETLRVDDVRRAVAQRRRNRWRTRAALVAAAAAAVTVVVLMTRPDSGERLDTIGRPDRTTPTDSTTTGPSGDEQRDPPDASSTTTDPGTTATSSTTPTSDTDPTATPPATSGQPIVPPTLTASLVPTVVTPNGRLVYSSVDHCPVVEGVRLSFSYWVDGVLGSGQEDALPVHDGEAEVHESGAWTAVMPAPAEVGRYEIIASCLTDVQEPSDPLPRDPAVIHAEYSAIDFEVVPDP